jgi:hypothetical protein
MSTRDRTAAVVTAAPPSYEDLYALYQLCGGRQAEVVATLARLWGTSARLIEPAVAAWLADLPPILPPSRSRSAPAVLPPAIKSRLMSARVMQPPKPPRLPGASAPVGSSQYTLASTLSGLHAASARLNAAAGTGLNELDDRLRHGPDELSAQVYQLPRVPTFTPVILTSEQVEAVPEHSVVHDWSNPPDNPPDSRVAEELAVASFMARTAIRQGRLAPTVRNRGGAREAHMRF